MSTDPRHGYQYQRLRKQWLAQWAGDTCCICGRGVDKTLSGRSIWGPTIEHTINVAEHPELALDTRYWRLSHLRCNTSKGASYGNARRARKRRPDSGPPVSRW
ncbi:MAG: hypothetical protein LCI03_20615 [Actinobacteria bacterium]|nr:hypothetical protein [Actinomycetota bacterium]